MVPHHQSAIEMARLAERQAEHPQIRELVKRVIDAQSKEIDELSSINEDLFGEAAASKRLQSGDYQLGPKTVMRRLGASRVRIPPPPLRQLLSAHPSQAVSSLRASGRT